MSKPIKQILLTLCSLLLALPLTACSSKTNSLSANQPPKPFLSTVSSTSPAPKEDANSKEANNDGLIQVTVGNKIFSATLAENVTAKSFAELLKAAPVVVDMSDYSDFEKVGSLGTSLPSDNSSISVDEGDIVLYNGNQIVVFYGAHSWSYTRLGKIDDLSGWAEALGSGDVTITFSVE